MHLEREGIFMEDTAWWVMNYLSIQKYASSDSKAANETGVGINHFELIMQTCM